MRCESCGAPVAAITIGSGIEAITMGSCEHCSTRQWRRHGEVIDLTDAIDMMRAMPSRPSAAPPPVGTTTARQLLQSGLPPRRVAAALVDELGLDDRAAHAALAAALQGANVGTGRASRTSV